jgi:hypothetical protein
MSPKRTLALALLPLLPKRTIRPSSVLYLDVHLATHRHIAAGRADLRSVRYLVHCCRYCDPGCILMSGKESQT